MFSVEFFPPRDAEDERIMWKAIRELESFDPAYVSITYGAGGKSRDGTIQATGKVAQDTTLVPMAHLTAVGHSVTELRHVIGWYAAKGVRNILALRGDPPGDVHGEWQPHPQGLNYAEELVRLVRDLGDFCVGVAAHPYGHPRSTDLDLDTEHLVRKFQAGADFAIAQLFFEARRLPAVARPGGRPWPRGADRARRDAADHGAHPAQDGRTGRCGHPALGRRAARPVRRRSEGVPRRGHRPGHRAVRRTCSQKACRACTSTR